MCNMKKISDDLSNEFIIHVKGKNCDYLQFRRLLDLGVKHGYALKPGDYLIRKNKISTEQIECAKNNYIKFCEDLNVDYKKIVLNSQEMHQNNIAIVDSNIFEQENNELAIEGLPGTGKKILQQSDGFVTNKEGIVLAKTNADCILMLFYDPVQKVIANVHSGWRGTFAKIAENAVNKMVSEYSCNPKNIICCICPSIRKCHFEVEEEVKNMCVDIFNYTDEIDNIIEDIGIKDGKHKWLIDTVLINKIMLKNCGLLEENIIDSGLCSVCNSDKIHSYRIEKDNFNLATALICL